MGTAHLSAQQILAAGLAGSTGSRVGGRPSGELGRCPRAQFLCRGHRHVTFYVGNLDLDLMDGAGAALGNMLLSGEIPVQAGIAKADLTYLLSSTVKPKLIFFPLCFLKCKFKMSFPIVLASC